MHGHVMIFAVIFDLEHCYLPLLVLKHLVVQHWSGHIELQVASFRPKRALGGDSLHSFDFVGADGYDLHPPSVD